MQSDTSNVRESVVEDYLCSEVARFEGVTRKIQYVGRRGASDRLVGVFGKLHIVELKRPRGGVVSIHQSRDAEFWWTAGIAKVYLHTTTAVDAWLTQIRKEWL